jgi:hypothetical protein
MLSFLKPANLNFDLQGGQKQKQKHMYIHVYPWWFSVFKYFSARLGQEIARGYGPCLLPLGMGSEWIAFVRCSMFWRNARHLASHAKGEVVFSFTHGNRGFACGLDIGCCILPILPSTWVGVALVVEEEQK